MRRMRVVAAAVGATAAVVLSGLLFLAPPAAADPASDAAAALASTNLYVGDPQAQLDRNAVNDALNSSIKIAILPSGSGSAGVLAAQIGRTLDPDGTKHITVGVVVGRTFDAASSKYERGYASAQAKKAVDANRAELTRGGDHPDLTTMLQDFARNVQSGPLVSGGSNGSSDGSSSGSSGDAIWPWLVGLGLVGAGGVGGLAFYRKRKKKQLLETARARVEPYYDRLANEVNTLDPKDNPTARQAVADAAERYNTAGSQLATADTVEKFAAARRTTLEGLHAAVTARKALGLDPGPELPPIEEPRGEQLTEAKEVTVQGNTYRGYPSYTPGAPYYYGGGAGVPGGWYSTPFWETLLLTSVLTGGFGGWGGGGYGGGYDQGYDAGRDAASHDNWGSSGGDWGGGGGDWGGGGGDWGGGGDSGGGSW
jgi:LPXTG-motif cell wall-anchored protein